MLQTDIMLDAIHANVSRLPVTARAVAGYVSGTPDIAWTAQDWGRFPGAARIRIDQSPGGAHALTSDVLDVENGAATPSVAAQWVKQRVAAKIEWSTIYGTRTALQGVYAALVADGGRGWFLGHVDCWLADWNLSLVQATALLEKQVEGLTCRAVQWGSPTSNPGMTVPGTNLTMTQVQCDISVKSGSWHTPGSPAGTSYRE